MQSCENLRVSLNYDALDTIYILYFEETAHRPQFRIQTTHTKEKETLYTTAKKLPRTILKPLTRFELPFRL